MGGGGSDWGTQSLVFTAPTFWPLINLHFSSSSRVSPCKVMIFNTNQNMTSHWNRVKNLWIWIWLFSLGYTVDTLLCNINWLYFSLSTFDCSLFVRVCVFLYVIYFVWRLSSGLKVLINWLISCFIFCQNKKNQKKRTICLSIDLIWFVSLQTRWKIMHTLSINIFRSRPGVVIWWTRGQMRKDEDRRGRAVAKESVQSSPEDKQ